MMRSLFTALLVLAGPSSTAFACTVCFGDPNSPMVKSLAWGIWVLMGFIFGVLTLLTAFFFSIYRKTKKLSASH